VKRLTALASILLVVCLVVPALAARPKTGTFKGKSAQRLATTVKTRGGEVTQVVIGYRCHEDDSHAPAYFEFTTEPTEVSDGRFSIAQTAPIGDGRQVSYSLKGHFVTSKRAKVVLRVRSAPCHSGRQRATLKLK